MGILAALSPDRIAELVDRISAVSESDWEHPALAALVDRLGWTGITDTEGVLRLSAPGTSLRGAAYPDADRSRYIAVDLTVAGLSNESEPPVRERFRSVVKIAESLLGPAPELGAGPRAVWRRSGAPVIALVAGPRTLRFRLIAPDRFHYTETAGAGAAAIRTGRWLARRGPGARETPQSMRRPSDWQSFADLLTGVLTDLVRDIPLVADLMIGSLAPWGDTDRHAQFIVDGTGLLRIEAMIASPVDEPTTERMARLGWPQSSEGFWQCDFPAASTEDVVTAAGMTAAGLRAIGMNLRTLRHDAELRGFDAMELLGLGIPFQSGLMSFALRLDGDEAN